VVLWGTRVVKSRREEWERFDEGMRVVELAFAVGLGVVVGLLIGGAGWLWVVSV
jgi:hypothetical protein